GDAGGGQGVVGFELSCGKRELWRRFLAPLRGCCRGFASAWTVGGGCPHMSYLGTSGLGACDTDLVLAAGAGGLARGLASRHEKSVLVRFLTAGGSASS